MLFTPITTSLKNNKQVTIRLASSNDASALLDLIKQYLDTSEYIPITSSDFNKTVAEIEAWIEKLNSTDNSIMLVAEHNGQLIGNLDLTGQHRKTLQQYTSAIPLFEISNPLTKKFPSSSGNTAY